MKAKIVAREKEESEMIGSLRRKAVAKKGNDWRRKSSENHFMT
jgi:hypothetical protein